MEYKKITQKAEILTDNEVLIKISAFDNEDSHMDIIRNTAFNRTIKNNFKNIKHIVEHYASIENIIGVPKEFEVKEDGLWVTSILNKNVAQGNEMYEQYKFFAENGMNMDHSIGYEVIKTQKNDELTQKAKEKFGDYYRYYEGRVGRDITELKLYEYSPVFIGSNPEANQIMLKSGLSVEEFVKNILTNTKDIKKTLANIELLKNELMHVEGTRNDPPETPQIQTIDSKQFATIFINSLNKAFKN